jgi:hypothetical protein
MTMDLATGIRWFLYVPALIAAVDLVHIDDATRRIPNSHLIFYFFCVVLGYLVPVGFILAQGAHPWPPLDRYYPACLTHACFAVAAGLGMWRFGMWPAGDAKLFILLSLWIPVLDPFSPLLPWTLTLSTLINIFVPSAIFVIVRTLWWAWKEKLRGRVRFMADLGIRRLPDYLRESQQRLTGSLASGFAKGRAEFRENPSRFYEAVLDGFAMTLAGAGTMVFVIGDRSISWLPAPLTGFAVFVVVDAIRKMLVSRLLFWTILIAALGWSWFGALPGQGDAFLESWMLWAFFISFFGVGMFAIRIFLNVTERVLVLFWIGMMFVAMLGPYMLGFPGTSGVLKWAFWGAACGLVYVLVGAFLDEADIDVAVKRLQPFDVLATKTLAMIKERDPEFYEEAFERVYPDGLLPYQAKAVREWCAEEEIEEVALKRTLPFAGWVFIGAALTLWIRWDVVSLIFKGRPGG